MRKTIFIEDHLSKIALAATKVTTEKVDIADLLASVVYFERGFVRRQCRSENGLSFLPKARGGSLLA